MRGARELGNAVSSCNRMGMRMDVRDEDRANAGSYKRMKTSH